MWFFKGDEGHNKALLFIVWKMHNLDGLEDEKNEAIK